MDPYKVLVVGCGGMSKAWLTNAKAHPDLKVVGLVDVRREAAEARAKEFELDPGVVYSDIKTALRRSGADVVFDVTIPAAHHEVAIAALRRGMHVLGEKPMSDSLPRAQRMVKTAQAAGKLYAVMQNRRYESGIRAVKSTLDQGTVGRINELHCDFFMGPHFGGFREEMGYPLLVDMAIHTFDQARFLGSVDPVSVYCHSFNPTTSWYKGDASAVAVFEMTDGVVYCYRGSWCAQGLPTPWHGAWRIVGGKGSLTWVDRDIKAQVVHGNEGFVHATKDVAVEIAKLPSEGHAALIGDFVECLKQGRTPLTDCRDNIKSLAMVFAAVKSARTGKRVKVQW